MSIITDVIESTKAIIQGMGVTLSYIPRQKWTVQYPEEPVTVQPRYRGQHLLHVDENGKEKCVACFLAVFIHVQKMLAPVAGLNRNGLFRILHRPLLPGNVGQRDTHALDDGFG